MHCTTGFVRQCRCAAVPPCVHGTGLFRDRGQGNRDARLSAPLESCKADNQVPMVQSNRGFRAPPTLIRTRSTRPEWHWFPILAEVTGNQITAAAMRILVVEDHEDTRQVLMRLLQHWGFTVITARTLQSGLRFLQTERFDAIVSDIALPDGTGYVACQRGEAPSERSAGHRLIWPYLSERSQHRKACRIRLLPDQAVRLPRITIYPGQASLWC
jgi:hypothetical protein